MLHKSFEWVNIGGSDTPWHHCAGDERGFLEFLRIAESAFTQERADIADHFEREGVCWIMLDERLRANPTGVVVEFTNITETHWKDGKLAFFREHCDTKKVNDAFLKR